jgi:hypothetical protein
MRWLLLVGGVAIPSIAAAHISLTAPTPRHADQKTGPCGLANSQRGANVTTLKPGSQLLVRWNETIQHPGHFRISFDTNGQRFTIPPTATADTQTTDPLVIDDLIPDTSMAGYSLQITLPNVECNNCTLQLIQLMTDKPPYTTDAASDDIYFQCADITLSNGAPTIDGAPPDAAPTGGGMPDASGGPGGGGNPIADNPYVNRGCATHDGSLGAALALAGFLWRRRRR